MRVVALNSRRVIPVRTVHPLLVVQRTHAPRLEPLLDAVGVEGVPALAPRDATLRRRHLRVALADDAGALDLITADAALSRLTLPG